MKKWLEIAELPKSSYYEWKEKISNYVDKDKEIKDKILEIQKECEKRYGYRRVNIELRKKGLIVNHKKVLRLMGELGVLCDKFVSAGGRYNSYKGNVGKTADNIVNRDFQVDKPNKLWLTDVTEFKVLDVKFYLSPILDAFNGEIIDYSLGRSPSMKLTHSSLLKAKDKVSDTEGIIVHTDQGFQYQHASWRRILKENKMIQSMSRKGNCLDNSPMENFFGILKQEMFYRETFSSLQEFTDAIDEYIYWYNNHRIKEKLNGLSPVKYKLQSA